MMESQDRHAPRPEFTAALRGELSRALRQEERLRAERPVTRWFRLPAPMRLAAALLIGLVAGAAPAQVQDAQQRRALLQAAEAEERLATIRLAMVAEEADAERKRVEAGLLGRELLLEVQARLRSAQVRLEAARLNIQEITATSASPRDDLAAPRVGQRDFVRERLMLQISEAELHAGAADQALALAARRHQVGAVSDLELLAAQAESEQARARVVTLGGRLELRDRAVAGALRAGEAERQMQLLDVQSRMQEAIRMRQLAEQRLASVSRSHAAGMASRAELLRAELDRMEWDMQLERLQRELRQLERP